ncbi:hypothetical protein [Kribbella steppae]|uniref:hypothetical protein n=1 Tax=Kribbella steppae TaxID=2512223 RepID=UPI001A7EFF70|nr:hypothetical protein [Kribbella steppae]
MQASRNVLSHWCRRALVVEGNGYDEENAGSTGFDDSGNSGCRRQKLRGFTPRERL